MEINMNQFKKLTMIAMVAGILTLQCFAASPETQSLYKAKCKACHGEDGVATAIGKKLGARDFSMPEVMKLTDAELTASVTNGVKKDGKPTMPAFKDKLKEAEIKDMVAYVRELGKKK